MINIFESKGKLSGFIKNYGFDQQLSGLSYEISNIDILDELQYTVLLKNKEDFIQKFGEEEYYNYYERYRNSLQPLMEWITLWAEDMNKFYENSYKNHQKQTPEPSPKGVASRTRSKRPLETSYEITPPKIGTNMITLEPTKQEGVRITLSDGKSYTYDEIKDMWRFNKVQTLYRHPYTLEDKQKITDFLDFGTKGGRKKRKTKKNKTKNNNKVYKKKSRKTRKQTVYL
jgi:hypothetical protein